MTQLRRRMIEDLRIRNYSPQTVDRYVRCVAAFARHFRRCPSLLGPEDIRAYQVHLALDLRRSYSTLNLTVCALRFLYRITLRNPFPIHLIPFARTPKKLPIVLSRSEVSALLRAAEFPHYHAFIATLYSTGIRLSELRFLSTSDLDASRGIIRVNGKGSRQRQVPLTSRLLSCLRAYWIEQAVDSPWLFPGRYPHKPVCRETIQYAIARTARVAGISKRVSPHTLRHTFATHLLEAGVDLFRIQRLLGHAKFSMTTVYLHLATNDLRTVVNPLDLLSESTDSEHNAP